MGVIRKIEEDGWDTFGYSGKELEGEVVAAAQINTVHMDQAREAEFKLSKAEAAQAVLAEALKERVEECRQGSPPMDCAECDHEPPCLAPGALIESVRALKPKEDGKTSEGE